MIAPRSFGWAVDGDGIGVATLDDVATKNALTVESYRELASVAREVAVDAGVRGLVITGANGEFSSGGNVQGIIGRLVEAGEDELRAFNEMTGDVVRALRGLGKPVVAAIDGVAVGGGAALALAADVRLATARARIGFVFTRVGLCAGDMGVSWLLPRIVGLGRAAELLLTGDVVGAERAERMGLVNRIVEDAGALEGEAVALARRMADGPVRGTAATKRLLDEGAGLSFEAALAREVAEQTGCMQTEDFREGYRAFVEKRKPRFRRG